MGKAHTVLDVVRKSADFLGRKQVENPRLNAEWLIAHALGMGRMQLYMQFDRPLQEPELGKMREYVARRGKREPLQYIIGQTPFLNLTIKCDHRALIPRPETEQLVEQIIDLGPGIDEEVRILDLGTGSGAIALALAMHFPRSQVVAIDESIKAIDLAKENALHCGLQNRVEFVQSDWFEKLGEADSFDLIVANPPYLTKEELSDAESEVKDFEPVIALVADNAGLEDLLIIIEGAFKHLEEGGSLWLETGIEQHSALLDSCNRYGYSESEGINDWSGRPRFVRAQR